MNSKKSNKNREILDSILSFFFQNENKTECKMHFLFLYETIKNLIENPQNDELRQFIFNSSDFMAKHLILECLENNGFMQCQIDLELYIIYTDPSIEQLKTIPEFIKTNYLENLMEKEEKAAVIASLYENRMNKNNSKKTVENLNKNENLCSFKSINSEYYQSKKTVEEDLMAYRKKMKEKHTGKTEEFTESKNKPIENSNRITNESKKFKRDDVFAFQNRRENEQRVSEAQNQMQEYKDEMKKRAESGLNPFKKNTVPIKQPDFDIEKIYNESYNKIVEEALKENSLNQITHKKELSLAELEKQRIKEDQIKFGLFSSTINKLIYIFIRSESFRIYQ